MWRLGACVLLIGGCAYSPQPIAGDDDSDPGARCSASDWFDAAYANRISITIDHTKVGGDLTDFPALVDLTAIGMLPSGGVVVFVGADGARLDHEIDTAGTDRLAAWVRIPALSASIDTQFYAYFNNPDAVDQAAPAEVWRDAYLAVYHLGQSPTDPVVESANGLDATSRGNMPAQASAGGKIGNSLTFDGMDDALDTPDITLPTTFTYEAWVSKHATTSWRCIIDNQGYDRWFGVTDSQVSFWDGTANTAANPMTADTWTYMVATYDGSKVRIYNGGREIGTIDKSFEPRTGAMLIGYSSTSVKEYFPGKIDEVRISSVQRSADYVATAFRNQDKPAQFAVAAQPESCQ